MVGVAGDTQRTGGSRQSGTRVTIVSMDSHVAPPVEHYRPYCEAAYAETFAEFAAAVAALFRWNPGAGSPFQKTEFEPSEQSRACWRDIESRFNSVEHYADAHTRLTSMDAGRVAERIGAPADEIQNPIEQIPPDARLSQGFRRIGPYA